MAVITRGGSVKNDSSQDVHRDSALKYDSGSTLQSLSPLKSPNDSKARRKKKKNYVIDSSQLEMYSDQQGMMHELESINNNSIINHNRIIANTSPGKRTSRFDFAYSGSGRLTECEKDSIAISHGKYSKGDYPLLVPLLKNLLRFRRNIVSDVDRLHYDRWVNIYYICWVHIYYVFIYHRLLIDGYIFKQ